MRPPFSSVVATVALAIVVAAQDSSGSEHFARAQQEARQVQADHASPASPAPVALPAPPTPPVAAAGVPPAVLPQSPDPPVQQVPPTTYSFSLEATNPTAVPLAEITASQSSFPTIPLPSTATAGAQPTFIQGAPALPDAAAILATSYPPWDKPPPVDSPEVQQWKQEVMNSGVSIPNFEPTNPGGCSNNTNIATDQSRCWWSCTGCAGDKDIVDCPNPLSWGLTYDDGPGFYTSNLLKFLDEKDLKSTFFVVGSRAVQFPAILQAQYMGQHQIAVHTWSHTPLTTQTNDEIIAELGWSKKVIKDVLGVTPNMMRPPFGDIDDRVRAISHAMGLTPVIWTRNSPTSTFDTDDFNIHNGVTPVEKVLQNWQNILSSATSLYHGFIVLEHDLFQESVEVATGYILPDALAHNPPFKIEPVIQCLGHSLGNAYIETNDDSANPPPNGSSTGSASSGNGHATKSDAEPRHPLNLLHTLLATVLVVGVSSVTFGLSTRL